MSTSTVTGSDRLALQPDTCGNQALDWDHVPLLADPLGWRWMELAELRRVCATVVPHAPLAPAKGGLPGLSVRVLDQPEVFAHYFGT